MTSSFHVNPTAMAKVEYLLQRAQEQILEEIAEDATRMAPMDTGALKASIHVRGNKVVVGTDHWIYPEYGTENMRAEPYMRPALYKKRHLRGVNE